MFLVLFGLALVCGSRACVTIPVALQYARLVGTKLYAVVKSECWRTNCRLKNADYERVLATSNDGLGIILK